MSNDLNIPKDQPQNDNTKDNFIINPRDYKIVLNLMDKVLKDINIKELTDDQLIEKVRNIAINEKIILEDPTKLNELFELGQLQLSLKLDNKVSRDIIDTILLAIVETNFESLNNKIQLDILDTLKQSINEEKFKKIYDYILSDNFVKAINGDSKVLNTIKNITLDTEFLLKIQETKTQFTENDFTIIEEELKKLRTESSIVDSQEEIKSQNELITNMSNLYSGNIGSKKDNLRIITGKDNFKNDIINLSEVNFKSQTTEATNKGKSIENEISTKDSETRTSLASKKTESTIGDSLIKENSGDISSMFNNTKPTENTNLNNVIKPTDGVVLGTRESINVDSQIDGMRNKDLLTGDDIIYAKKQNIETIFPTDNKVMSDTNIKSVLGYNTSPKTANTDKVDAKIKNLINNTLYGDDLILDKKNPILIDFAKNNPNILDSLSLGGQNITSTTSNTANQVNLFIDGINESLTDEAVRKNVGDDALKGYKLKIKQFTKAGYIERALSGTNSVALGLSLNAWRNIVLGVALAAMTFITAASPEAARNIGTILSIINSILNTGSRDFSLIFGYLYWSIENIANLPAILTNGNTQKLINNSQGSGINGIINTITNVISNPLGSLGEALFGNSQTMEFKYSIFAYEYSDENKSYKVGEKPTLDYTIGEDTTIRSLLTDLSNTLLFDKNNQGWSKKVVSGDRSINPALDLLSKYDAVQSPGIISFDLLGEINDFMKRYVPLIEYNFSLDFEIPTEYTNSQFPVKMNNLWKNVFGFNEYGFSLGQNSSITNANGNQEYFNTLFTNDIIDENNKIDLDLLQLMNYHIREVSFPKYMVKTYVQKSYGMDKMNSLVAGVNDFGSIQLKFLLDNSMSIYNFFYTWLNLEYNMNLNYTYSANNENGVLTNYDRQKYTAGYSNDYKLNMVLRTFIKNTSYLDTNFQEDNSTRHLWYEVVFPYSFILALEKDSVKRDGNSDLPTFTVTLDTRTPTFRYVNNKITSSFANGFKDFTGFGNEGQLNTLLT